MQYSREYLRSIIDGLIKYHSAIKGKVVTEDDIAVNLLISPDLLLSYLNGNVQMPEDFVNELKSKYGIRSVPIQHRVEIFLEIPDDDEEDEERGGG